MENKVSGIDHNEKEIDFVEIIEQTSEGLTFDKSSKQLLYEPGDNIWDKFKIKITYKDGTSLESTIDITNSEKEREYFKKHAKTKKNKKNKKNKKKRKNKKRNK